MGNVRFNRINVRLPRDVAQAYAFYRNGLRLDDAISNVTNLDDRRALREKLKAGDDEDALLINKRFKGPAMEEPEKFTEDEYDEYITDAEPIEGNTWTHPKFDEPDYEDFLRNGGHIATQWRFNGPGDKETYDWILKAGGKPWDLMAPPEYGVDHFGNTIAGQYAKAKMRKLLNSNKDDTTAISDSIVNAVKEAW